MICFYKITPYSYVNHHSLLFFRYGGGDSQMSPKSHTVYWDKKVHSLQQTL